nr:copia protein [Tanacetum cinerariifolium]
MGTVRIRNDHVAAILGFGDLQWGNILITRVYFVEGLCHNFFSVGQFCDSDLEVAFRRDACFVRNLEGVDLLKGDRSINLYTISLYEMASASPICLMARASSTKSWLWHQRLSHLNFDTINDLAKNDLVAGLPKFKYHKEHLCPSCEQGKRKIASHPPKPVPNSRQRLHLLYMDLCEPMRIASINGKRKPDISYLYVFGALCYPKNDGEDIGKLGAKGDIGFFIGSKPGLQSMTSGHISSGLDLTYASSTITTQQPSEGELDLLFEAMYDDYFGGQPSATVRTIPPVQEPQVHQTSTASTIIADTAPIPTNSSSHATNILITLQDSKYVLEILNKYGIESCDHIGTPMEIKDKLDLDQNGTLVDATKYHSMIGALMYLTSSRLDIVHATCLCAQYQAKPTEKHLKEVKRIFRYLRGTVNMGLWYSKDSGFELTGFSDVDYTGCKDTFKSASGGAQFLGEKLVSWSLKKQDCTALSTVEAKYVSLFACCAQVLWMRTQLTDYGFHFDKIPIYCDSKSAIAISCNPVQHSRTKHIAVRYHFIKEHVEKGTIELYFVKTDYQLADIFTKALPTDRFNYLVRRLARAEGIYPGTQPLDRVEVLELEQTQQGSSHGVSVSTEGVEELKRIVRIKCVKKEAHHTTLGRNQEVLPKLNLPGHRIRRWRYNITPAESKFKTPMLDHQDKYMMKAQRILRGRLLASFQDLEHEGGDTRSQGSIKENDSKIKIHDHWRANDHSNEFPRTRLQVSRKVIIVTEATIREALCLDDVEGVDYLPNEETFAELARMGYEKPSTKLMFYKAFFLSQWKFLIHKILQCMSAKRTSWNEFSSSMASAGDEEEDAYENIKEVNAGVAAKENDSAAHGKRVKHLEIDKVAQDLEITKLKRKVQKLERRNKVSVLKLRRLQKVGTSHRVETFDDTVMDDESNQGRMIAEIDQDDAVVLEDDKEENRKVATVVKDVEEAKVVEEAKIDEIAQDRERQAESQAKFYKIDMDHANKVLSMQEDGTEPSKVQEVVDVVTTAKLITEVVTAASETVTAASAIITTTEAQVPAATIATLTVAPDKGKGILVEEPKPLKKKQQIKQDEQYARKLHAELNKDIDLDEAIDHVKRKAKEDIAIKGQIEEDENKALQKINKTLTERATKRKKLDKEIKAMQEELNEFERLEVWELVPRPDKLMVITLKWIYKVARLEAIRIFFGNAAHINMFVYQMDVKTAFLNGNMWEESKYALESLKKYGFKSCDPVDTPMVEKSKLDEDKDRKPLIRHIIMARPTEKHLHAVKRIFRYLRGTVNRGLWYPKDSLITLTAFADVDHAGCQDTRRNTSGSLQLLGDRLISWSSKRSKHIDIRYYFSKEHVENMVIEIYFVNTEYQLVDIFTKALGRERIEFLINKLGMRSFTQETLQQLTDEVDE